MVKVKENKKKGSFYEYKFFAEAMKLWKREFMPLASFPAWGIALVRMVAALFV